MLLSTHVQAEPLTYAVMSVTYVAGVPRRPNSVPSALGAATALSDPAPTTPPYHIVALTYQYIDLVLMSFRSTSR